jgi:hypothetical protein
MDSTFSPEVAIIKIIKKERLEISVREVYSPSSR